MKALCQYALPPTTSFPTLFEKVSSTSTCLAMSGFEVLSAFRCCALVGDRREVGDLRHGCVDETGQFFGGAVYGCLVLHLEVEPEELFGGAKRRCHPAEPELAEVRLVALGFVGLLVVAALALWVERRVHVVLGAVLGLVGNERRHNEWGVGDVARNGGADGLVLEGVALVQRLRVVLVDGGDGAGDGAPEGLRDAPLTAAGVYVNGQVCHGAGAPLGSERVVSALVHVALDAREQFAHARVRLLEVLERDAQPLLRHGNFGEVAR